MDRDQKKDRSSKLRQDQRKKDHKRPLSNANASGKCREVKHPPSVVQSAATLASTTCDASATESDSKVYSKRQIASNWAKYEVPLPSGATSDSVSQAADFATLLDAPLSLGGHFQFKQERTWDTASWKSDNLFNIDLKRLSECLSCVAFYKQASLMRHCFTQDELDKMDQEAERNRISYMKRLSQQSRVHNVCVASTAAATEDEDITTTSQEVSECDIPLLVPAPCTELDNSQQPVGGDGNDSIEKEENLENWLNSILDD